MFETVLDVRGDGVLSGKARPSGKRAVSHLRNPCLPAVFVGGLPQSQRCLTLMCAHCQPFSTIAIFHCSLVVRTCSLLRQTCEA